MRDQPTVILGAGLCGLSAAYHLEQKGRTDYLIVEREDRAGGLARTETCDGYSFDHAIHILFSRDALAAHLITVKLLGAAAQRQTRRSCCYSAGIYTEYPYQLNHFGLPPEVIVDNLMGLIEARYGAPRNVPVPHFEAWIYRTYGRGIAERFMIPYNRRQWAWDLQDMNYDWIVDRVPAPDVREVLRGALQPQAEHFGPNSEFWYPAEGGIEALAQSFLKYIPAERFWPNATVTGIDSGRRQVVLADGRRVPYGRLISTLPLPAVIRLLGDAIPQSVRQRTTALKANTVHTVNLGLEGTALGLPAPMHWAYFPEPGTIFHRLSFPGSFSPWMVPPGGCSIQAEISESPHHRVDRETLIEKTLEGLVRVGILREGEARPAASGGRVRLRQVVTLDPAYVIYDLKHRENTRIVRSHLSSLNIYAHGRFGEWEYFNMDHAILSGKAAAEAAAR